MTGEEDKTSPESITSNEINGVKVSISGIHDEDKFTVSKIHDDVSHHISKLTKMFTISELTIHVKKYHDSGSRVKYSVQAKLITNNGIFFADDFSWELSKSVAGTLSKIESEVMRKEEKMKSAHKNL